MKNYVVRFTRTQCGRAEGNYAAGRDVWAGQSTPDLQKAYVYNSHMQRHGYHKLTAEEQAERGVEVIFVDLVAQ
ncbi:hypothetical protein DMC25_06450 [Caulobacter sp. D4A]|uniref:hypothetical protein n=1 Tax=unclassified Caulobacter TaxID=2648921 RepID=UPI000D737605|nr:MULTISPECIES: hypothetical protein [unclassified Caulobacter]PXA91190.1 hypothetical protein DMC25_06450 [Caulobacter sp. D4A]PXA96789.1 hypothetical protein DMC18_00570 [Caulobacter sp. D5]